jgi:hypothetical protein
VAWQQLAAYNKLLVTAMGQPLRTQAARLQLVAYLNSMLSALSSLHRHHHHNSSSNSLMQLNLSLQV